jgi:hypothetical protein
MWTYRINDGTMTRDGLSFVGYSGAGHDRAEGRNNPDMQHEIGVGPIPVGTYEIGMPHYSAQTGPYTMNLDPLPGTNTFGRTLFRIHGNNAQNDASHGCVILPPNARRAVWDSGDHVLEVVV